MSDSDINTDDSLTELDCATHGRKPWDGQVMCQDCGRTWRLGRSIQLAPSEYPYCDCGSRLAPGEEDVPVEDCSAVPICADCYTEHKPRVPEHVRRNAGSRHMTH